MLVYFVAPVASDQLAGWPPMAGVPLFPHVYTKEATFSISFDGSGGAPPLSGGCVWADGVTQIESNQKVGQSM